MLDGFLYALIKLEPAILVLWFNCLYRCLYLTAYMDAGSQFVLLLDILCRLVCPKSIYFNCVLLVDCPQPSLNGMNGFIWWRKGPVVIIQPCSAR